MAWSVRSVQFRSEYRRAVLVVAGRAVEEDAGIDLLEIDRDADPRQALTNRRIFC